jgi:hypothetical protein
VDSQETYVANGREYRVARLKINPKRCGNFDLAIAGSGKNGNVIDGAVGHLHKAIAKSKLQLLSELQELIEAELREFRKDEAAVYSKADLGFRLVICARSVEPKAVEIWTTQASHLEPIPQDPPYALVGWEEYIYHQEIARAYPFPRTLIQATILGVHVITIASQTSRYVDGPIRAVVALPSGMWFEDKAVISELEQRLGKFSLLLADLFLSCPDTTMKSKDFEEKLSRFEFELLQLRADYIQAEGERFLKGAEGEKKNPFPHLLLPRGSVANFRSLNGKLVFDVDEDEERTKKHRDQMLARLEN